MGPPDLDEGAGAEDRPHQIDPQDLFELAVVHLGHRHAAHGLTGIVDEDVEDAELGGHLGEGRLDGGRVADIVLDHQACAPGGLDPARGLPRAVRVGVVGDRHVRAFAREQLGRSLSDTGIRPGDQSAFALQLHVCPIRARRVRGHLVAGDHP